MYDLLGRVTQVQKVIDSATYIITYAYNLAGELTLTTYPSNRAVDQQYDSIGRLSQIQSGATTYLSNIHYHSAGLPTQFDYGNGVQASFGYNDRLQLASLAYAKVTQPLLNLAYGYSQGGGNSGQITSITDGVDSTRSTTYTYDAWARLKTAQNGQWGLSWDYDRFGNRKNQNVTAGSAPAPQLSIDANTNRISGYSYDEGGSSARGNLTNDTVNKYTYDAESRVREVKTQAGSLMATYSYDGSWVRVKKQVNGGATTVYVSSGTKVIAEYENGGAPGSPTREYIHSGSQLLATIEGTATTYHHADHLSARLFTDASGTKIGDRGHYPFGEAWYETGSTDKWKFTSYERDGESALDYAMFRYDSSRLGRFMTPDPIAGSIADPQSLNRYAYGRNDPVNLVDPLGLDPCPNQPECRCWRDKDGAVHVECPAPPPIPTGGADAESLFGSVNAIADRFRRHLFRTLAEWDDMHPDLNSDRGDREGILSKVAEKVKSAVSEVCSWIPDVSTLGGGFDAGVGITGGYQGGVAANGRSGEASLVLTTNISAGLIAWDAYVYTGFITDVPTNSMLNTKGSPSFSFNAGAGRTGASIGRGNYQFTFGPSLSLVTAAAQGSVSKTLITAPYWGYVMNPQRAACKAATGR